MTRSLEECGELKTVQFHVPCPLLDGSSLLWKATKPGRGEVSPASCPQSWHCERKGFWDSLQPDLCPFWESLPGTGAFSPAYLQVFPRAQWWRPVLFLRGVGSVTDLCDWTPSLIYTLLIAAAHFCFHLLAPSPPFWGFCDFISCLVV